jgi:AraC-like DNA-binding protein/quercetin dioxygenase-like cupin family protein
MQKGQSLSGQKDFRRRSHYPSLDWPVVAMAKEFPARTSSGAHSHKRAQLLFAVKGLMVAHTAAGTWVVPRGHALWIPANLTHNVSMHGDVAMRTAYVRAGEASRLFPECRVLKVGALLQAALIALADEARGLSRTARAGHLIWLVLDEIKRAPSMSFVLPMPEDSRLARLAHSLMADPGSARTIDQWCDVAGASRRTLTRLFRAQTGISFGDWRRRLRVLSAAARVADGEALAEVAAGLGYRNAAAFRTMMRRQSSDNSFPDLTEPVKRDTRYPSKSRPDQVR